jgi:hypothetical protein
MGDTTILPLFGKKSLYKITLIAPLFGCSVAPLIPYFELIMEGLESLTPHLSLQKCGG